MIFVCVPRHSGCSVNINRAVLKVRSDLSVVCFYVTSSVYWQWTK